MSEGFGLFLDGSGRFWPDLSIHFSSYGLITRGFYVM